MLVDLLLPVVVTLMQIFTDHLVNSLLGVYVRIFRCFPLPVFEMNFNSVTIEIDLPIENLIVLLSPLLKCETDFQQTLRMEIGIGFRNSWSELRIAQTYAQRCMNVDYEQMELKLT